MKNSARKNTSRSKAENAAKKGVAASAQDNKQSKGAQSKKNNSSEDREILYQVKTKRTSDMLKAYITFTYRVLHPSVTPRLMIYGLIVLLPGIFYFKDLFWRIFFIAIGIALILLGLFRQYISLSMTKKNDADYKNGTEFTYNFTSSDADFFRADERVSGLDKYKDITNFYYDDDFFYMGVRGRELHILPKSAFTIGDASTFEEFVYKKGKVTCKWLPNNFRDQLKQRRAYRRMNSSQ